MDHRGEVKLSNRRAESFDDYDGIPTWLVMGHRRNRISFTQCAMQDPQLLYGMAMRGIYACSQMLGVSQVKRWTGSGRARDKVSGLVTCPRLKSTRVRKFSRLSSEYSHVTPAKEWDPFALPHGILRGWLPLY
jgi:hypothetical protein